MTDAAARPYSSTDSAVEMEMATRVWYEMLLVHGLGIHQLSLKYVDRFLTNSYKHTDVNIL